MSTHYLDDSEGIRRKKHKNPKFRDYYDEEFNTEDEKALHARKKKLGKKPRRKKNPDRDWPQE